MLGLFSYVAAWPWHLHVPLQQPEQLQVTSPACPPPTSVFATTCLTPPSQQLLQAQPSPGQFCIAAWSFKILRGTDTVTFLECPNYSSKCNHCRVGNPL